MKKLITAAVLMSSLAVAPAAPAVDIATPILFAAGVAGGIHMGRNWDKPTPFHLTEACKPETVKAKDGNYSYTSYEHCLKQ